MRKIFAFACLLLPLFHQERPLVAQAPLRLENHENGYLNQPAKQFFKAFLDESGELGIEEIRGRDFAHFDSLPYPTGYLRNNNFNIWLRCQTDSLTFSKTGTTQLFWFFGTKQQNVVAYRVDSQGVARFERGVFPGGGRLQTLFLTPIIYGVAGEAIWYFKIEPFPFKVEDFSPTVLSAKGWNDRLATRYYENRKAHNYMVALTGIVFFMTLFSLAQLVIHRNRVFLYYAGFLFVVATNLFRYDLEFVLPVTPVTSFFAHHGNQTSTYLGHFFYFWFVIKFLSLEKHIPWLYRLTRWGSFVAIFLLALHFFIFFVLERQDLARSVYYNFRYALLILVPLSLGVIAWKRPPFFWVILLGGTIMTFGATWWMVFGLMAELGFKTPPSPNVVFYTCVLVETLIFVSGLGYQFTKNEEARRRAQVKLMEERHRISRDLHDDLGSSINSLALMSELVKREAGENLSPKALAALDQIKSIARKTVLRTSDIVWSVNPKYDSLEEVFNRARDFAGQVFAGENARLKFKLPKDLETMRVSPEKRWHLYVIIKEALNNARKYAGATLVEISIEKSAGRFLLKIRDNGVGFSLENSPTGNGLLSMRNRAELLGGFLEIESKHGAGTEIRVIFG